MEWNLNSFSTKAAYLDALHKLLYKGGATNTAEALAMIRTTMLTTAAGDRQGFRDVIVVITDGRSNNHTATLLDANQLHYLSGDVISIGIGVHG